MNKHTMSDLYQMQSLPLSIKIRMTQNRIREWEEYYSTDSRGIIPNYSYMADLVGIDRREDKENDAYQSLIRGEIPDAYIKTPTRYLILMGKYLHL